ncbi:MAG: DUF5610 domain-containing protein [Candidatus Muirbacterium halophilum]|nr:DUF5610 domain-containing protein [Candidatus Muirbacterium halophilum]MCK9474988.1 DUF5610 domain-containing protein [Candidatus Muirbacterium halophilum]
MDLNLKSMSENPYLKNLDIEKILGKDASQLMGKDASKTMDKVEQSMNDLKKKLFGSDELSLSPEAMKSMSRYQSISILQEETFAQFKDDKGNEFTYAKSVFKLSYTDILSSSKKIEESEKSIDEQDEALGEWSSDAVSERLVDFAKNIFKLFQTDKYQGDESLKNPEGFMKWAKKNIISGFDQATGVLSPMIKQDDFLSKLIGKTYDKTMKGLEDAFQKKSDDKEVNESVEYYESFELELEITYVGVKFSSQGQASEESEED